MKLLKLNKYKEYSIFIWLILISFSGILVSNIYSTNKEQQSKIITSSLENIYLKKTISELTNSLEPRFTYFEYLSKPGDNYQIIIDKLKINKKEKDKILNNIKSQKSLKILRINQKFTFKLDNMLSNKVIEFKIETDKKNEIVFTKLSEKDFFETKKIVYVEN